MTDHSRIFHLFVAKLSKFPFLQTLNGENPTYLDSTVRLYDVEDDLEQGLYYLRTLSNILRWSSDSMWAALAENTISTDASNKALYRISI